MINLQNDDILWWALPCLTAAETYGRDAQIPDGAGFVQTAKNTVDQAYENYDLNVCGGGLFWPRFPELAHLVKPETYKSTITNSLFVYACARLYRLTNDAEYLKRAQQVYDWLYRIRFVGSQGQVFDGAHAMDCLNIDDREYSYNNGQFLLANIELFKATNNATFKQNAQSVYNRSKQLFIVNNIIKDTFCEPNCRPGLRFHKAVLVKSLVEYYTIASPQEQQEIKSAVTNSFDNMVVNNCDSNYNCGNLWDTKVNNFDFHTQIGALELANAYINVNYGGEKLKRVGFGGPETNLAGYQSVVVVVLGICTFWFLEYIY